MRLFQDFRQQTPDADASSKLEARRKYGLPEQGILISNKNRFNRIMEETLLSWFRILVGILGSYLVLLDHGEIADGSIKKLAQENGCAGRVLFLELLENESLFSRGWEQWTWVLTRRHTTAKQ